MLLRKTACLVFSLLLLLACSHPIGKYTNVLVVTGGHEYDTTAFRKIWDSLPGIHATFMEQPEANRFIETGNNKEFDVLVFYDMWKTLSENQKNAWVGMLDKGKGIVFLHHSIAGYPEWPEYLQILGGRYHDSTYVKDGSMHPASDYTHGLEMPISIADPHHPITNGITDFTIVDEAYGNLEILDKVHPLLYNHHPKASKMAAWTNQYGKSRIVYIALGHDEKAYGSMEFRKLMVQSIWWVKGQ